MAGRTKQPIEVVIANGKKHLTKEEIEKRRAAELKVDLVDIKIPEYLNDHQKEEFSILASKLKYLKIMTELDEDALARYIVTREEYLQVDTMLQKELNKKRKDIGRLINIQTIHNRLLNQVKSLSSDLGLTISSRVKLVVPQEPPKPKENKFNKFINNGKG